MPDESAETRHLGRRPALGCLRSAFFLLPLSGSRPRRASRPRWGRPARWGLVAGAAALVLYAVTGARDVEWQDAGLHQYRILTGQLEHPLGLALSHPLHYWLGRAALRVPIGDAVHRLNLLSGLCGAVGVGVVTALVIRLTRNVTAGGVTAATLALAHAYWQMSALAETYTLAVALMAVEWVLLLRYLRTERPGWLVAVFAVNGLHVANHLLGLLTLTTYLGLLLERIARRRLRPAWSLAAAGLWLAAVSPYGLLILSHLHHTGDWVQTAQSALFGGGAEGPGWKGEVLNVRVSAAQVQLAVLSLGYCFPSAATLVALVGVLRPARGPRRLFRVILLAQTVLVFAFVGRYPIADLYTYFVPVCALTALWFGLGAGWLLRRWTEPRVRRRVAVLLVLNALLPPVVYYVFPLLAQEHGWMRTRLRDIPHRNEYLSFFRPWRFLDDSAPRLAHDAIAEAGPDGWIVADSTTAAPIAITYLRRGGTPQVRVFWGRNCLTQPGQPSLTDEALVAHVLAGGTVLAVPAPHTERLFSAPLYLDKSALLWRIRVGAPPPREH